eukprot:8788595-Pyramimonas_sp.AAC.1
MLRMPTARLKPLGLVGCFIILEVVLDKARRVILLAQDELTSRRVVLHRVLDDDPALVGNLVRNMASLPPWLPPLPVSSHEYG